MVIMVIMVIMMTTIVMMTKIIMMTNHRKDDTTSETNHINNDNNMNDDNNRKDDKNERGYCIVYMQRYWKWGEKHSGEEGSHCLYTTASQVHDLIYLVQNSHFADPLLPTPSFDIITSACVCSESTDICVDKYSF